MSTDGNQIQQEQAAFDATVESLLPEHEGQYVVFKQERPASFFGTFDEAYEWALRTYGLGATFLVSEVKPRKESAVSLSWDLGAIQSAV